MKRKNKGVYPWLGSDKFGVLLLGTAAIVVFLLFFKLFIISTNSLDEKISLCESNGMEFARYGESHYKCISINDQDQIEKACDIIKGRLYCK